MYPYEQEAVCDEVVPIVKELDVGNSRMGIGIIFIMSAFVGLWGVACLISGLATLPGLKIAIKTLMSAFIGV